MHKYWTQTTFSFHDWNSTQIYKNQEPLVFNYRMQNHVLERKNKVRDLGVGFD